MRESRVTSILTLGGLLVLSVVVVAAGSQIAALDGRITEALNAEPKELQMQQTITEVVTRANGTQVTVTTTRGADESVDAFIARHDAVTAALKA